MAKTATIAFRIEEDRLTYIDEIITRHSAVTGIKTRSAFIGVALEFYLTHMKEDDERLVKMGRLFQAREEAAFWAATEKQLSELIEQRTPARLRTAREVLSLAADALRTDAYDADIDNWSELLAPDSNERHTSRQKHGKR